MLSELTKARWINNNYMTSRKYFGETQGADNECIFRSPRTPSRYDILSRAESSLELSQGIQKHYIDNLRFVKPRPRVNRGPTIKVHGKFSDKLSSQPRHQPRLGLH